MSAEVDYLYSDNIFQGDENQNWNWELDATAHYWGFAVIPEYANVASCEITRFWYSTDNQLKLTAHFDVRVTPPGALLGFKAIRAPSA